MPAKSVDVIVTDSPYNIGISDWDRIDNYLEWSISWIKEAVRLLKGNGRKNRKQLKGSLGMYQYYATHPEEARADLQILCANCNWIKKFEREEIRPHWRREEFEQKKNEVNMLTFIPSTVF